MSDESIQISRAVAGDKLAAGELFRTYETKIFTYLCRMLRDRADAEDATQECFVNAYAALNRYEDRGHFKAWLFRIAHREGLRRIRSRQRQADARTTFLDLSEFEPESPTPAQISASLDESSHLIEAMNRLPEAEKQVVLLRTYSGLTFREIAEIMNAPLNTTLGRMHNALKRLKADLTELNDEL